MNDRSRANQVNIPRGEQRERERKREVEREREREGERERERERKIISSFRNTAEA